MNQNKIQHCLLYQFGLSPNPSQTIQVPSLISTAHADDDGDHGSAKKHGDEKYEWLKEVHEFFGNFTLFLVLIHLAGVFVESVFHKESLVRAMWTGRKRVES